MDKQLLERVLKQVPPDYYEQGFKINLLQKIWHGEKWKILEDLLEKNSRRILDVGCASGHITYKIKRLIPKARVVGIDVSKMFIDFAQKQYPEVEFICSDAHKLSFRARAFDAIVCTELLEHVVNPKKVLREIRRCLKDDGSLIVSMDSGSPLFRIVWFFWTKFGPGRVWRGSHLHQFTSESLRRLLLSNGFSLKNKRKAVLGMAVFFKVQKR